MKKSFLGFLIAIAVCAIAASSLAVAAVSHAADMLCTSCRAFKDRLVADFMALATPTQSQPETAPYARSKEFKARIEKRERPVVTASWRSCPSI